jgi:hypothetical protein
VAGSRSGFFITIATELDTSPATPRRLLCFDEETSVCVCTPVEAPNAVLLVVPR